MDLVKRIDFLKIPCLVIFIFFAALSLQWRAYSQEKEAAHSGDKAPYFLVKAGDDKELALEDIKGKIAVIIYESTSSIEKNQKLKDELDALYDSLPDGVKEIIEKVPVINASETWPFTALWQTKLRQQSRKRDITIYGDWSGGMLADYGLEADDSNIIILDTRSVIRYKNSGFIDDKEIQNIKKLLTRLVWEAKIRSIAPAFLLITAVLLLGYYILKR
jgi:predicted transcriptional regulator